MGLSGYMGKAGGHFWGTVKAFLTTNRAKAHEFALYHKRLTLQFSRPYQARHSEQYTVEDVSSTLYS